MLKTHHELGTERTGNERHLPVARPMSAARRSVARPPDSHAVVKDGLCVLHNLRIDDLRVFAEPIRDVALGGGIEEAEWRGEDAAREAVVEHPRGLWRNRVRLKVSME